MISFWNDSEWKARSFFEDWIRSYVNYDETNARRGVQDYRLDSTVSVAQWSGQTNKIIAQYVYEDCSPLKLEAMELDQSNANNIETFKVEFHYSKWTRYDTTVNKFNEEKALPLANTDRNDTLRNSLKDL